MTVDSFPYIDVRLYGRSLQKLKQDGISLKKILEGVGFSGVSIREGRISRGRKKQFTVPSLSTSIANVDVPRSSTPIVSQVDIRKKITWNLQERISEIADDDEEKVDFDSEVDSEEIIEESRKSSEQKKRDTDVALVLDGIMETVIEKEKTVRSTAAILIPADEMTISKFSDPVTFNRNITGPVYCSIAPAVFDSDHGNIPQSEERKNSSSYGLSNMDAHHSFHVDNIDETADLPAEEKTTERNGKHTKTFKAAQKTTRCTHDTQNTAVPITCNFPKCGHVISWRIRSGKINLVDHALKHSKKKFLKCHECKNKAKEIKTIRSMRYHYQTSHKGMKMTGYGVSTLPLKDPDFRKLLHDCFGDQLDAFNEELSEKTDDFTICRSRREVYIFFELNPVKYLNFRKL
ncbi:CRE-HIM-8 protein [Caenorhabditis remanei]|uniref:CRE-HIM-8 protein n=2 Tax=Caenorhabditis remanei TaxID=31234 RepID=E3LMI2_CAERE|nr:CRE-HIM-8 protein [Caenorhabditis remanei]